MYRKVQSHHVLCLHREYRNHDLHRQFVFLQSISHPSPFPLPPFQTHCSFVKPVNQHPVLAIIPFPFPLFLSNKHVLSYYSQLIHFVLQERRFHRSIHLSSLLRSLLHRRIQRSLRLVHRFRQNPRQHHANHRQQSQHVHAESIIQRERTRLRDAPREQNRNQRRSLRQNPSTPSQRSEEDPPTLDSNYTPWLGTPCSTHSR